MYKEGNKNNGDISKKYKVSIYFSILFNKISDANILVKETTFLELYGNNLKSCRFYQSL